MFATQEVDKIKKEIGTTNSEGILDPHEVCKFKSVRKASEGLVDHHESGSYVIST